MNVEEGSVCREHSGSIRVAAAEVQAQVVLLFKLRVFSTGRRDHMIVVRVTSMWKEPTEPQQSDLLKSRAHDHGLKMIFFLRIERYAKD